MDEPVSQFRKHAHDGRELARRARSEHERALYEDIASHWEALAELWPRTNRPRRQPG
ncbi:MAG: hypothetical protein KGO51_15340 [Alphaproteobacteria bacterium]|nr:hypothetical protein [Alphaproteobacteria bacterium]